LPPAGAILFVFFLLWVLPARIRVMPVWFPYVSAIVVLGPMAAVGLARMRGSWLSIERMTTFLVVLVATIVNLQALSRLVMEIVRVPEAIGGIPLLTSSIAIWVMNVLTFSLLYWQIDRGGPSARARKSGVKPDWTFPRPDMPEDRSPDWRPFFLDYLFLGFCTATAFSPTDALPLTRRAKMLIMIESTISLLTIVIVAARAINILK
jgi:uncharacterized membrane protein